MTDRVRETASMIAGMSPDLQPGTFVFATLDTACPEAIATIREAEGLSVILPLDTARAKGLPTDLPMRMITLRVHSALDGVGLTAAVATALAEAGIPCNMVAGHHHDHAFVPAGRAEEAVTVLRRRAGQARA